MPNGLLRAASVQTAAVVGSYFPRQCGIATFSKDLRDAVAAEIGQRQASVIAIRNPRLMPSPPFAIVMRPGSA